MPADGNEQERPSGDWAAVARAVRDRMNRLPITQLELAAKAEVSLATVQELTRGVPRRRYGRTLTAISSALGWPPDRIERIAAGEVESLSETATNTAVPDEIQALRVELARISQRIDQIEAEQKGP